MKPKLIIIAGPTAIGKSGTAVRLAKEIDGEIISADSMQVYRGMDIGSAKITSDEMQGVPHHMIDILDPNEDFNAVVFQIKAKEALAEIYSRGKTPIICGGTGFYIQALLYDIDFTEEEDKDETYRNELWAIAAQPDGYEKLKMLLTEQDPAAAETMDFHNTKRVIRALEFYKLHGFSISIHNEQEQAKKTDSPYDYRFFVMTGNRDDLYARINQRVDLMVNQGMVEECRALKASGLRMDSTAAQGIGYKEIYAYLDGKYTLEEAIEKIKVTSRRYAKKQLTWFKREQNPIWIDIDKCDPLEEIRKHL